MNNNDRYRRQLEERVQSYLDGTMPADERYSFEHEMEMDPFLADAVEGMSSLDSNELLEDLGRLDARVPRSIKRRGTFIYRFAAAAVILLAVSSVLLVKELRRPDMIVSGDSVIEKVTDTVPARDIEKPLTEQSVDEARVVTREDRAAAETRQEELETEPVERLVVDDAPQKLTETLEVAGEQLVNPVAGVAARREELVEEDKKVVEMVSEPVRMPEAYASKRSKAVAGQTSGRISVTGQVLDSGDSLPLPGAVISVKGSSQGVTADMDGRFSIVADTGDVLVASFIGMKSKELEVKPGMNIEMALEPDMMALEEVVVTGYGISGRSSSIEVTEIDMEEDRPLFIAPEPECGMKLYREYIEKEQVFPSDWLESDREVVRIKFDVLTEGTITNIEIVRSPSESFSEEAKRLLLEGPAWKPALSDDNPYVDSVRLRIVFRR